MPLEPFKRGSTWWVRGRIDFNGRAITPYYRCSTGASSEAGARDWIRTEEARCHRAFVTGTDAAELTFAEAVVLYDAKPAEARYLIKILPHLGDRYLHSIVPQEVRDLGSKIYPTASTDTWRRQVLSPVSAVINNAHQLGQGPAIRIKGYSTQERIDQDARRGKQSRPVKRAGSWEWIDAVAPHCNPYLVAGLEFMFETGCRIGQLCAVRPADLDLPSNRIRIIAQKGHPEQWVGISPELVARLANLSARRPHDTKGGKRLAPRVFGYETRGGFASALRTACKAAGVPYLSPHEAGRHGFYTELRVRQGVDPVSAAKAGRWSDPKVPDAIYAEAIDDAELRARIRASRGANSYKAGTVEAVDFPQGVDRKRK